MPDQPIDQDALVLESASNTLTALDIKYRRATSPEDQDALAKARDDAFSAYVQARTNLLRQGIMATNDDVVQMEAIRQDVNHAADTQAVIVAAGRLVGYLARFVV
ncbi:hypothetical protein [Ferrovibrio sp.]|uniref:hypothetical protein n=1 Tax=Ferrovibrio sp. TaxID=1917215 RepID=UPI003D271159